MLNSIAEIIKKNRESFDEWHHSKLISTTPCIYSSVDLRYSGEKLVPIDTNLFPAGFNNLSIDGIRKASVEAKKYIEKHFPDRKKLLIIGENHNRNNFYLKNLENIKLIFHEAGFITKACSLEKVELENIDNSNVIEVEGYIPDLIILNNDLSHGLPELLKSTKQNIIPHPNNGWFRRRKSLHFRIYDELLLELENLFQLPSFFLRSEFDVCANIDFKSMQAVDILANKVDLLLKKIKQNYSEFNIKQEPYVVIKSDFGTYGMGVMTAQSGEEVLNLNKKLRKQMHITKSNMVNNQVIIQEGISTIDKVENNTAEPLLYLINHQEVEFFYRTHSAKNEFSNLNSIGMEITNSTQSNNQNYLFCCNFVAKLASLAASLELR